MKIKQSLLGVIFLLFTALVYAQNQVSSRTQQLYEQYRCDVNEGTDNITYGQCGNLIILDLKNELNTLAADIQTMLQSRIDFTHEEGNEREQDFLDEYKIMYQENLQNIERYCSIYSSIYFRGLEHVALYQGCIQDSLENEINRLIHLREILKPE